MLQVGRCIGVEVSSLLSSHPSLAPREPGNEVRCNSSSTGGNLFHPVLHKCAGFRVTVMHLLCPALAGWRPSSMPFGRGICLIWTDCLCTVPYSFVTYCCCSYNIDIVNIILLTSQESNAKVFEHRQKKKNGRISFLGPVTLSHNHLATSHC